MIPAAVITSMIRPITPGVACHVIGKRPILQSRLSDIASNSEAPRGRRGQNAAAFPVRMGRSLL